MSVCLLVYVREQLGGCGALGCFHSFVELHWAGALVDAMVSLLLSFSVSLSLSHTHTHSLSLSLSFCLALVCRRFSG